MNPTFALFFLGFMIGVNVWLYWVGTVFGLAFTLLLLIGMIRTQTRLISAFIFGLFIGFS